jgi:hypothetical protein
MPKVDSNDIPLIPHDLATLFPMSIFRCKSQSRDLSDWERGFWRVDLCSWPESEKLDFWKKMHKVVTSGRFGWIYILFDVYQVCEFPLMVGASGGHIEYLLLWWSGEKYLGVVVRHVK